MLKHTPSLADLFNQLGLASDIESIEAFVERHQSACKDVSLVQAPIWTESQLNFLQEAVAEDSEWAQVADTLYLMLSR